MSGIPSWARVGAKVVCVDDAHMGKGYSWEKYPIAGEVYTIRAVDLSDDVDIRLVEIVNPDAVYEHPLGGQVIMEVTFHWSFFRPLITQEHDIKTHFRALLDAPQSVDA